MTKLNLYTSKGTQVAKGLNLPKNLEESGNMRLLSQAIRVYEDKRHFGLSKTKTRSEIDLTKKKAYRQKGTGMARHGAKSAPIFVGGSKAHGPKGIKRNLSLPKKMRQKALKLALAIKAKENEVVVVGGLDSLKKTKDAHEMIVKLSAKEKKLRLNKTKTFFLSQKNKSTATILSNLDRTKVINFTSANAYDIYLGGFLLIDEDVFSENGKQNTVEAKKTKTDKEPSAIKKADTIKKKVNKK